MSMFPVISVTGSGLNVDQAWIDTIGGNLANAQDAVSPGQPVYRPQYVEVQAQVQQAPPGSVDYGEGVAVKSIQLGSAKGVQVPDPGNPLAVNNMVTMPDVNVGHELVSLIEAQTDFQANAAVLSHATSAYQSVLAIKS